MQRLFLMCFIQKKRIIIIKFVIFNFNSWGGHHLIFVMAGLCQDMTGACRGQLSKHQSPAPAGWHAAYIARHAAPDVQLIYSQKSVQNFKKQIIKNCVRYANIYLWPEFAYWYHDFTIFRIDNMILLSSV